MNTLDQSITGTIWTSRSAVTMHREICLRFNGRFCGSPDSHAAAEYIRGKMAEFGLENPRLDRCGIVAWHRGTAQLGMTGPVHRSFPCIALPYAPACDTELPLLDLGMGHPGDIENAGDAVKGAAVMVSETNPPGGPNLHRLHKYLYALEAGAAAFLFVHARPGMHCQTGSLAFNHGGDPAQALPAVGIPLETSMELQEWLKSEPVSIRLTLDNTLEPGQEFNVMGDILPPHAGPGTPMIIVGGHYDGHDISQGANDNASGTVVTLEIARALAPLAGRLGCRFRFVLFGGEEMGLIGSHQYVLRNRQDMPNIRMVLNLDCVGSDGELVLMTQQDAHLADRLTQYAAELPSEIVVDQHLVPFSDHFPFLLQGVPTVFAATPGTGGRGWGHTVADTFEKVHGETLQRVAAHLARVLVRVSHATDWPQKRRTPAEIQTLLEPYRVEQLLKHENHWPF